MPVDPDYQRLAARTGWAPRRLIISALTFAAVPLLSVALGASANDRVRLEPKFAVGETLRYHVQTRTTTTGETTTPVENPEGEGKVSQTIDLVVRLDIFGIGPATSSAPEKVRLNALFEQSRSNTDRDALNPAAPSPDDLYSGLQGHSIRFALGTGGELSDFDGTEDLLASPSEADPVLSWVKSLSVGARFPREGIAIGQKWSAEKPLVGLPLADLVWRTESTYLRNEPCSPSAAPDANEPAPVPPVPAAGGLCAVVLTRFEISRRGSARSESTPDEYLRNGLRTSGTWTGSGESLDTISLSSGLLVSSTQTGTQDMDYEIASTTTSSHIHHSGHVENQSHINLLPSSQQEQ